MLQIVCVSIAQKWRWQRWSFCYSIPYVKKKKKSQAGFLPEGETLIPVYVMKLLILLWIYTIHPHTRAHTHTYKCTFWSQSHRGEMAKHHWILWGLPEGHRSSLSLTAHGELVVPWLWCLAWAIQFLSPSAHASAGSQTQVWYSGPSLLPWTQTLCRNLGERSLCTWTSMAYGNTALSAKGNYVTLCVIK